MKLRIIFNVGAFVLFSGCIGQQDGQGGFDGESIIGNGLEWYKNCRINYKFLIPSTALLDEKSCDNVTAWYAPDYERGNTNFSFIIKSVKDLNIRSLTGLTVRDRFIRPQDLESYARSISLYLQWNPTALLSYLQGDGQFADFGVKWTVPSAQYGNVFYHDVAHWLIVVNQDSGEQLLLHITRAIDPTEKPGTDEFVRTIEDSFELSGLRITGGRLFKNDNSNFGDVL